MLVLQRMASTFSSHTPFSSSLRLSNPNHLNPPIHKPFSTLPSSLLTTFISTRSSPSYRIKVYAKKGKSGIGVSTSSAAVAVDSTRTASESEVQKKEEGVEEKVVLPTNDSSENLLRIRHTSAHVMAMAVQKLFPDAKVTIGPWIDNGFYYDFDMEPLTDKDLKRIKKEMGSEFISCIICRTVLSAGTYL